MRWVGQYERREVGVRARSFNWWGGILGSQGACHVPREERSGFERAGLQRLLQGNLEGSEYWGGSWG